MDNCPLIVGDDFKEVPPECMSCEPLWSAQLELGSVEFIPVDRSGGEVHYDGCNSADVEFSHEVLQAATVTDRVYGLVDVCGGCQSEIAETQATFQCPKPVVDYGIRKI